MAAVLCLWRPPRADSGAGSCGLLLVSAAASGLLTTLLKWGVGVGCRDGGETVEAARRK